MKTIDDAIMVKPEKKVLGMKHTPNPFTKVFWDFVSKKVDDFLPFTNGVIFDQ